MDVARTDIARVIRRRRIAAFGASLVALATITLRLSPLNGMGHRMKHYPSQISSGQQQRVAVARALGATRERVKATILKPPLRQIVIALSAWILLGFAVGFIIGPIVPLPHASAVGLLRGLRDAQRGGSPCGFVSSPTWQPSRSNGGALGATRRQIAGPILREALVLAGIGIAIGAPLTLPLARFIRSSFYGVGPADPITFSAAAILFLVVALVAAWVPARRAVMADPMEALRHE